jgi:hypothetical protein
MRGCEGPRASRLAGHVLARTTSAAHKSAHTILILKNFITSTFSQRQQDQDDKYFTMPPKDIKKGTVSFLIH